MQPTGESHEALIQPGGHCAGGGGIGGGGEGGRPEEPDQESQCGVPPHLFVVSEPGQLFSQQQDRGSPREPRGVEHVFGACDAVRLLSQFQAVHLDSPQQATLHALKFTVRSWRRSQPVLSLLDGGDGEGQDGAGMWHLSAHLELFTIG